MASSSSHIHPEAPPSYNQAMNPAAAPNQEKKNLYPDATPPNYQQQNANPAPYPPPSGAAMAQPMLAQPTSATIVVGLPVYGSLPATLTCPNCHQNVVSVISCRPGLLTWLLVGGLALFGLWCGCCLIPLCVDDCQDVEHTCPNCKALLGTYKRL